jgi:predicted Mrr-cat superfamily restriction endonuclease
VSAWVAWGASLGDAQLEVQQSRESVILLDRDAFIQLLLAQYDKLEPEYRAMVPLRKVWIPVE